MARWCSFQPSSCLVDQTVFFAFGDFFVRTVNLDTVSVKVEKGF